MSFWLHHSFFTVRFTFCLYLGRKQLALGRRVLTSIDMVHRLAQKVIEKLNHKPNLVHQVRSMAPTYFVFLLIYCLNHCLSLPPNLEILFLSSAVRYPLFVNLENLYVAPIWPVLCLLLLGAFVIRINHCCRQLAAASKLVYLNWERWYYFLVNLHISFICQRMRLYSLDYACFVLHRFVVCTPAPEVHVVCNYGM